MRRAIILGANVALGAGVLGWVLYRTGFAALEVLGRDVSPERLLGFVLVAALAIGAFAWRWQIVLAGLGSPPRLAPLTLFRLAGQTVAALVPSAKIGGDPLRAWLVSRRHVSADAAIATVAIDRALEIGAAVPFSIVFAAVLIQHGVPGLENTLATMVLGAIALVAGAVWTARRLRKGGGLVTAFVRRTRLDAFAPIRRRMDVLAASEITAARLVVRRRRMLAAFGVGFAANLLVLAEYHLLLSAFGLPAGGLAVVAAIFGTAAAHQLPVPAGIGVLEGGLMWLFEMLGYPAEVGLAVGLAVRLRELLWALPGAVYLAGGLGAELRSAAQRTSIVADEST